MSNTQSSGTKQRNRRNRKMTRRTSVIITVTKDLFCGRVC